MQDEYSIRQINLNINFEKTMLIKFLNKHSLKYEENIEVSFGVYSYDDNLVGCGCASNKVLKCFAIDEELRGQNILGTIVSRLVQDRFQRGIFDLFVITRLHNESLFTSCGFYVVSKTDTVLMLENNPNGVKTWADSLKIEKEENKSVGSIVMNCNPFTLGHRHLVEYASSNCDVLHIFVVEEDASFFSTKERLMLVNENIKDLKNVKVHLSGPYIISNATFPTYFLKEGEDAAKIHTELDAKIFAEKIAPLFNITKRFVGEEPLDQTTNCYNNSMEDVFENYNVSLFTIPRLEKDGKIISATEVRYYLQRKEYEKAFEMLPQVTIDYLKEKYKL